MMRRLRTLTANLGGVDPYLATALGVLLFYGIPVVWGAGGYADRMIGVPVAPHYLLIRHLTMIGIGVVVMLILANTDHTILRIRWVNRLLLGAGLVLVAYTLKDGAGLLTGRINRWIIVGPIGFQPVEAAKLAAIFAMARILTAQPRQERPSRGQVLQALAFGLAPLAALLVLQPNFGNVLVMLGVTLAMLFVAGTPVRWLAGGVAGGLVAGLAVALPAVPKLAGRFGDWMGAVWGGGGYHYQVQQSIVGLGAGGLFGVGPGQSHNKFFFLPESHTDFVFSVLGEEWGLFGTLIVIAMVTLLAWRGYGIAARAPEAFGRVVATGLTTSLVIYAVANIGMATGLLPVIGVPLPFVSYGGTAMVGSLAAVGVLLNIERSARTREVERKRWERRGWSG
jgi:cell division protein FtsW